jgi:peroxiredoxin
MLETGALAPHFTLLGIDGKEYRLPNTLEGQPSVLVIFKTTCATCDLAFPYINRLRETYVDGWQQWAIAQDPPDIAADYANKHGITYPVLIDAPDYEMSRLYDPAATPTLFLNDKRGRVAYATHGFAKDDLNQISRLLAEMIGQQPEVVAEADDGNPAFKPG